MNKKLILISIAVTLLTGAALWRHFFWIPRQASIRGEVVETFCWTTGAETGPAHAACGIDCAKRGIPIAVYDAQARRVYVLLPARDKGVLPPTLIAAMGQQVTIQGDVIKRGGSTFLTVKSFALN